MNLKFNPSVSGLSKVFRDYQILAMRVLWEGEGLGSGPVHARVNERLGEDQSVSRASIIQFLNKMVDEDALNYIDEPGRGGYHRVYSPKLDERGFVKELVRSLISSLMKDYPDETIVCPWTHDPMEAMQWIDDHLYAMTGAGIPQSHYLGFQEALNLFHEKPESWVHDRVVVHIGDSEPGFDDAFEFAPDGPTVTSVLALAEAGIKVHSVLCGPDEVPENMIYRWYADVTGGHFVHGADRIVPGVTRDPTWIVKLTPITPFDSFRMPLRSSEPTMKEGFYTFHIYVDFFCKAVPWHEWFLTELTAHLEKAEIPPRSCIADETIGSYA